MRRVALAVVSTVTGLVMLLSFKTHSATTSAAAGPTATAGPDTPSGAGGSASAAPPSPSTGTSTGNSAGSPASSATKTVTGDAADTRYGPVQVQITVSNGKLTGVTAVDYPQNDPRDQEINAYAIPQLNNEALAAKSAKIDMVSGATYTSDGYIQSLQSALDQAGL
jgi:uncharacterized protein with FMN-binding domain